MDNIIYTIKKDDISSEQVIDFWAVLGWGKKEDYDIPKTNKAINDTYYLVAAKNEKGQLVGLSRVFGDGYVHTSLAEIAVLPDYQKKGIGSRMMEMIKEKFGETGIFLEASEGTEDFFEKCGYVRRDNMKVYSKRFIKK